MGNAAALMESHRLPVFVLGPLPWLFLFACGKFPGFAHVYLERFITDLIQFDTNPPAGTDVRWFEVRCRSVSDKRGLKTGWCRHPHGEMTVFVVIVHEHCENAFVLVD